MLKLYCSLFLDQTRWHFPCVLVNISITDFFVLSSIYPHQPLPQLSQITVICCILFILLSSRHGHAAGVLIMVGKDCQIRNMMFLICLLFRHIVSKAVSLGSAVFPLFLKHPLLYYTAWVNCSPLAFLTNWIKIQTIFLYSLENGPKQ